MKSRTDRPDHPNDLELQGDLTHDDSQTDAGQIVEDALRGDDELALAVAEEVTVCPVY